MNMSEYNEQSNFSGDIWM